MKPLLMLLPLALLLEGAAVAGVTVVGGLSHTSTLNSGESFDGTIVLRNSGDTATDVSVSQTDYLFYADGRNHYDPPGGVPRSNAGWFSVNPTRVTIPPRGTVSVYYQGRVPDNPELAGTYWSMVMIEPSAPPAPKVNDEPGKTAIGLKTVVRFGVQIITNIGEAGTRELRILDRRLVAKDGRRELQLDVENTGQQVQTPSFWLELFTSDGVSAGRFEGGRMRVFPACSVRYRADLGDVPPGRYTALVILDNGSDEVTGAQYQLDVGS